MHVLFSCHQQLWCVSVFPNAQPDPIVSGGSSGSCVACGIVSGVGGEPSDLTALGF